MQCSKKCQNLKWVKFQTIIVLELIFTVFLKKIENLNLKLKKDYIRTFYVSKSYFVLEIGSNLNFEKFVLKINKNDLFVNFFFLELNLNKYNQLIK